MNESLDSILKRAYDICQTSSTKKFEKIYPFTTENISGYCSLFDLNNKSLLTVGSSGDQVLNAILNGCKDITVCDINKFTKSYYYLKVAFILNFEREDFLKYFTIDKRCNQERLFTLYHLRKGFLDRKNIIDKNFCLENNFEYSLFEKIKDTLRYLDYESYLFFDDLFQNFPIIIIVNYLFSNDFYSKEMNMELNPYLKNDENYHILKNNILKSKVTFITDNILTTNLANSGKTFDVIWLSNICSYLKREEYLILFNNMNKYLKDGGTMLFSYLYDCDKSSGKFYEEDWAPIYNINKVFEDINGLELQEFTGINSVKYKIDSIKDSAFIYKKIKKL